LLFVIDSNEYIFAFGPSANRSRDFLEKLLDNAPKHTIRVPRTIFKEVQRNLSPEAFQEFHAFIHALTLIDEDLVVPFEVVFKYENRGLKPADAFIAAYTEWTGADALVTENRHFLTHQHDLPFNILTAEKGLKLL
jgi:predicted nucleic acid-binding protein